MDKYLKDFEVDPKNPSEEAQMRWRRAAWLVKNPRRRFRMVADLAKRSEAEKKKRSIQEKIRVALHVKKEALAFINGAFIGENVELLLEDRNGANTIQRQYIAKEEKRDDIELLLLITSLVLEAMSALFEQLQYALLGMLMAILGLILCLIELAYKVRKENATWEMRGSLPWFYSRHPHQRLFGSIFEYFGLVAALWQFFHSTIGYLFALQGKGNPIRMTVVMFLFSFCLLLREFKLKYSKMSPRHSTEP